NYTNGPIEGKMNKIKVLKRVAFGFRSFKNFRLRILLSSQATTLNIKEKKSKKITAKQLVLQAT
ncbi:transposase, partial [Ligilactobacillus hayakitensis]|uniref:transposase n=1 Tax=Ligilactobacillus hayakitensis TaxID=396716 RepID=UPI000A5CFC5E